MAAPSSDHTNASKIARTAPATQARMAWGPPIALITKAVTTNGPMPTISIMLSATASFRPRPRSRPVRGSEAVLFALAKGAESSVFSTPQRIANADGTSEHTNGRARSRGGRNPFGGGSETIYTRVAQNFYDIAEIGCAALRHNLHRFDSLRIASGARR